MPGLPDRPSPVLGLKGSWFPFASQETGDSLLVLTYVVSSGCHALLLGQLLYYWNAVDRLKEE